MTSPNYVQQLEKLREAYDQGILSRAEYDAKTAEAKKKVAAKLKQLRDSGIISEREFEAKKSEIFGNLRRSSNPRPAASNEPKTQNQSAASEADPTDEDDSKSKREEIVLSPILAIGPIAVRQLHLSVSDN